jgi:hypothetical protein
MRPESVVVDKERAARASEIVEEIDKRIARHDRDYDGKPERFES